MPRQTHRSPFVCEFFSWRLFERDGVIYADGRTGSSFNLGKHSLGTRDPEQALVTLRHLDRQMAVERGLASPAAGPVPAPLSVKDGWQLYLKHCQRPDVLGGVSPRTMKRYRAVQDKHLRFCDKKGIQSWIEVSKDAAVQYGTWLDRQGYASRTIYLELTLVKSVILWLIAGNRVPPSCRLDLELEKPQGTDTYCFTREQVNAMVGHCRARPDLQWLTAAIVGLSCTGLRISELASLKWADLDLGSAPMVRLTDDRASSRRKRLGSVRTTKGRRGRVLPIHHELLTVLLELKRHPDGRVFHGPRDGILKPDTVRVIFLREVIKPLAARFPTSPGEVGFEHATPHSFRHYFCSQAFVDGAAEADIRDWLGHRDSKMVAHYRHLSDADSQRKMQQINFLGRGDGTVPSRG
jgi:integrase